MALFSKRDREHEEENEVRNPIEEIQSNSDYSGKTFVSQNDSPSSQNNKGMTNISSQAALEGIIKIEGDITINGKVKGSVTCKGKAIVGQSGMVEGDILAQNAEISGTVTGKVEVAELLSLKGAARINGDIYTDKLQIDKEAKFNGKCVMGKKAAGGISNTPVAEKPKTNTLNTNS